MNVLIIEDEFHTSERLSHLIQSYDSSIQILQKLSSVSESIKWLSSHKSPDLIFQDIELSDGNCFDIYQSVEVKVPIVFTTAFSEYALKAFQLNSIDYIVKPYDATDIKRVLDKYSSMKAAFAPLDQGMLKDMLMEKTPTVKNRFLVRIGDQYKTVAVEEISFIRYEEGVNFIYLFNNEKYPIDNSLTELESQLNQSLFFRINRKYIININAIKKIDNWFNSRIKLELAPNPNDDIIISRERMKNFKKWLDT
ncbi:LytR/AlgR family response regulator transcription factor [Sediminitomix flava]|uniref:LytTR family two component transcriptional regulator n=1 Tax=Sediminitomix flava TaxID=379075 RepID=A0A315ZAD4_SEDFL|nr:response regulator transcription factor [Sediminitomix flava]PWJ42300.1 LytTR family two component transcriptional regulator [Sediminitomix flava]